jgi:proteasome lid subunit RPN8/RPN11
LRAIHLSESLWNEIELHLAACLPEEGCGLLGGLGEQVQVVVPIENAEHSSVRYTMEPHALVAGLARLETLGLELLAAFHSHPAGPDGVSQSDVVEWQYPEAAIVVCTARTAGWRGLAFVVDDGRPTPLPLHIDPT